MDDATALGVVQCQKCSRWRAAQLGTIAAPAKRGADVSEQRKGEAREQHVSTPADIK